MKSCWGSSANNERKGAKLVDIMSEQAISQEYPDLVTPVEGTDTVLSQQEMDDLRLAQLLQEEEERGAENLDDRYLAEYLQQLEMAELASSARPSLPDSLAHAKITTKSAYDDIATSRDREAVQLPALVTSSRFGEAVRRDRETEHLSSAEKAYLARHDPLLSALGTAHALSELEGVGDLPGQGLLVPSSVAQPVKSFLHKQQQSQEHSASAKKTSGSHSQK